MKPIIKFNGYQIQKLEYIRKTIKSEEPQLERKVSIGISDDKKNSIVILTVELKDAKTNRYFELELIGEFDILEDLEEEKIEDALSVNGVALLYPYARSIISMISTLDASSAIVLPTINTKIFNE